MAIVVKKGEYLNVNLKNLNPKHTLVATVKGTKEFTTKFGDSTLVNFYVHRVLDEEGQVYEQVDKDAGMFISNTTKYTKELLSFLVDNVNSTVSITLDRIEPRTYSIPSKTGGMMDKVVYTPIYVTTVIGSAPAQAAPAPEGKPALPMPKGVFVQLAKASGVAFDGVMNVQGKEYKVSDYVTQDEFSS